MIGSDSPSGEAGQGREGSPFGKEMKSDRKRLSIHTKIFIGLLLGAAAGVLVRFVPPGGTPNHLEWLKTYIAQPAGRIFLRLLFMAVIPLAFSALAVGVAQSGSLRKFGRIGIKSLLYTAVLSSIAVFIGVGATNLFKPGTSIQPAERKNVLDSIRASTPLHAPASNSEELSLMDTLTGFIPVNPVESAAKALEGGLVPLLFFALILGVAMSAAGEETALPLRNVLESVNALMMQIIGYVMKLAPYGVAALVFSAVTGMGIETVSTLLQYFAIVMGCLLLHVVVVYSIAVRYGAKRSPVQFFRDISAVIVTAFATSSSNATLPTTLRSAKEKLKLPDNIASFVLTLGATGNQNGTALYEGVTILFLAQFCGVELTLVNQLVVVGLAILAGVGTAGVPGGSLPFVMAVLAQIGVPPESAALILGIDRVLDMSRTVVNVAGDLVIASCVAASEAG
jgi:DAACS family dicarboxylate/amino acid:cation (Na+ or H+) symporter